MILAAVGVVLLIACANIAGLLLARSAGRYSRARDSACAWRRPLQLARLLFIESLLLASAGGVAGLILAVWTRDVILALAPAGLPRLTEVAFDARVLLFRGRYRPSTGILFGLVPALPVLDSPTCSAR